VPYHWDWHQEDPDVGDQVRDVGEVRKCDHLETFPGHIRIPVGVERATRQKQSDGYANAPRDDECSGRKYDCAEDGMDEDAVVEGEDTELDTDESKVVEVAEDVVSLLHHHLVVGRHGNDMPSHAMRRA